MARMRRLTAITALYTLVAAVAVAAPLSASEEPPAPAEAVPADPAAPAPTPAAEPAPAPADPAAPAAPAAPTAPAAPAAPAQPAPAPAPAAPAAAPAEPQALVDNGSDIEKKTKDKPTAIAAASTTVTISDFKFSPAGITVNVGDTITWSNNGPTGHSATANDGGFDTGILDKGSSGSHTFTQAGTFSYICTPHPFMKGTVTVVAAAAGGGGGGGGTGSGSTSGTTSSGSQTGSGPALPSTGMDVGGLLVLGLSTLLLGAYLRRRTAVKPIRPAGRIGW